MILETKTPADDFTRATIVRQERVRLDTAQAARDLRWDSTTESIKAVGAQSLKSVDAAEALVVAVLKHAGAKYAAERNLHNASQDADTVSHLIHARRSRAGRPQRKGLLPQAD